MVKASNVVVRAESWGSRLEPGAGTIFKGPHLKTSLYQALLPKSSMVFKIFPQTRDQVQSMNGRQFRLKP